MPGGTTNFWIDLFSLASVVAILRSLTATAIATTFIWFTRKIWTIGFHSDVIRTYKTDVDAHEDINKKIRDSKSVKILSMRGSSIVERGKSDFPQLWEDKNKEIEIILSSPDNVKGISDRADATGGNDDEYKDLIEHSFKHLSIYRKEYPKLIAYQHMMKLAFKLVILDDSIYVFYFLPNKNVHKSPVIKYKGDAGAYEAFLRYYETIRDAKETIKVE